MANYKVRPCTKKLVRASLDEDSVGRVFIVPELRNFERGSFKSGFCCHCHVERMFLSRGGGGGV